MADDTPLFIQYQGLKDSHPGEILFFRVGDFYEMFDEQATEVSRLLNLTLTHRAEHNMCGIPYHAAKIYIARLLRYGKKVTIAEQIGDVAYGKGLTKREVVETITPGTALESEYLDGGANNYLASFYIAKKTAAFAYIDVTTGEFRATDFPIETAFENFKKELGRTEPKELLLPDSMKEVSFITEIVSERSSLSVSYYPDWHFNVKQCYGTLLKHFKTANLNSFSLDENSPEIPPAGFLLDYLEKTTNTQSPHVAGISIYRDSDYVIIDDSSRKNLEITENLRDSTSAFTLLECLNYTATSMGMRMLRHFLMFPLKDVSQIRNRQEHVELFYSDNILQRKFRSLMNGILDIERFAVRIAMDRAHAKDLKALENSLLLWLQAQRLLGNLNFAFLGTEDAEKIIDIIHRAITDDPSTVFTEGRIIKSGWSEELDHWRDVHDNFNDILEKYAEEERQATGIQKLKIKQTAGLGYYIEISKGKVDKVPERFILKRGLLNVERFTTEKLKELESSLNDSGERILQLEHDLFISVRSSLKPYVAYLRQVSREIAYADCVSALAEAAVKNTWVRPFVSDDKAFEVKEGRHPVVEKHLPSGEFVPNDLSLMSDSGDATFALITGPNMAGKSTFLRQNALITLLCQIGSFVPCSQARLGVVDRIFCRVGASDNLARGESTFLVEMSETARILRTATDRSFVIMDEVGRGTSTEDGLSIAWAVSEYLLDKICCKTLFATHYHELTRLENAHLKKLCMAVNESGSDVVFLRKVISGSSANSYGIHVARLAGIPDPVIKRASSILERVQDEAEDKPIIPDAGSFYDEKEEISENKQSFTGGLFSDEELVLDEILSSDPDNLTPLKALQLVTRWKIQLEGKA